MQDVFVDGLDVTLTEDDWTWLDSAGGSGTMPTSFAMDLHSASSVPLGSKSRTHSGTASTNSNETLFGFEPSFAIIESLSSVTQAARNSNDAVAQSDVNEREESTAGRPSDMKKKLRGPFQDPEK
jgi:hypothetical protein